MTKENIFQRAHRLLSTKRGSEMTEEELQLISTAIIPLTIKTDEIFPDDITISEGLLKLARMVEGEAFREVPS